jgi:hypothetical protein
MTGRGRHDPRLSAEWRVVLEGTRAALGPPGGDAELSRFPRERVDWDTVSDIAYAHRVAPLLLRGLESLRLPVPASCRQALKRAYVANAAHNAAVFRTLAAVFETFALEGIEVVALKGAGLAETVYRDRALRPMNDLDLLVREEVLEDAAAALRRIGYEPEPSARTAAELRQIHHHWRFRSVGPAAPDVPVELHWRLDPPGWPWRVDLEAVRARAATTPFSSGRGSVLAPEDLLATLPLHICRHRFRGGLISLCDIAAIVTTHGDRIDWQAVAERATAWQAGAHVDVVLRLTAEILGAAVPPELFDALGAPSEAGEMLAFARERTLERKGALGAAAELGARWRRSGSKERWAAAGRRLAALKHPRTFARRVRNDATSLWAWVRNPRTVAAAARREMSKSALDLWCSSRTPGPPFP